MEPAARPSTVVKCEKHGFFYDSAKVSGCAVCRRESGELPPPRPAGAARPAGASGAPSGSLGGALAVTALLVVVTTFAMSALHSTFLGWLRDTGNASQYEQINTYQQQQMDGVLKEMRGEGEDGEEGAPEPE